MSINKSKLKVFAVAINNYPNPKHKLYGCKNDLIALKSFLKQRCNDDLIQLDFKSLIDEDATREKFIDTFLDHFKDLKNNDTGLLYFSGHGSQMDAPQVFWHNTPNHKLETIVCYDSRSEGGWDIADKEIAYLIWKVTQKKKVQFSLIMDCCHAGSINRNKEITTRRTTPLKKERAWKDFLGAKHYIKKGNKVHVPVAPHLLFAACRNNEFATEKFINEKARGVFNYSLIQVLQQTVYNLSFHELHTRVLAHVKNQAFNQHPQLKATTENDKNKLFLGNAIKTKPLTHLLFYVK